MNNLFLIILLLILIVFLYKYKKSENLTMATEAVNNISKVYADITGTVSF